MTSSVCHDTSSLHFLHDFLILGLILILKFIMKLIKYIAVCCVLLHNTSASQIGHRTAHDNPPKKTNTNITHVIHVDPTVLHPVSPLLYGIFFEEVRKFWHACSSSP